MAQTPQEPKVRMGISHIEQSLGYVSSLEATVHDSALEKFEHHCAEAIHQLREWAKANDIQLRDGMKT